MSYSRSEIAVVTRKRRVRRTEVRRTSRNDVNAVRSPRPSGKKRPILPPHPGITEKATLKGLAKSLDEPRSKIAVAMRKQLVRRSSLRRSGCDEIDAVKLLRPKGEECRKLN